MAVQKLYKKWKKGFTLVELLVVIVVLAVIAAIVMPKFLDSSNRSRLSAQKADIRELRTAVDRFKVDTGLYPKTLSDLTSATAPTKGMNDNSVETSVVATQWHGPYIEVLPKDPVTGVSYVYSVNAGSGYTIAAPPQATPVEAPVAPVEE